MFIPKFPQLIENRVHEASEAGIKPYWFCIYIIFRVSLSVSQSQDNNDSLLKISIIPMSMC